MRRSSWVVSKSVPRFGGKSGMGRRYVTTAPSVTEGRRIIIAGGGIAGLSAAYFILQQIKQTNHLLTGKVKHKSSISSITILESSNRVGGWMHSTKKSISSSSDPGNLMEMGPRTLRPAGIAGATTLDLVHSLGLENQLTWSSKTSPAAKNRYLWMGKSQPLLLLPSKPISLAWRLLGGAKLLAKIRGRSLIDPIGPALLWSILREPFIPCKRFADGDMQDESIHSFISRRFSPQLSNDLVSAIVHGIYAGDTGNLSVRSCMKFLWDLERQHGSIIKGLLKRAFLSSSNPDDDYKNFSPESRTFIESIQKKAAIYSFQDGLDVLSKQLERQLVGNSFLPVQILCNQKCTSIEPFIKENDTKEILIKTSCGDSFRGDLVISCMPNFALSSCLLSAAKSNGQELKDLLSATRYSDVVLVHVMYNSAKLAIDGFGFLVPASCIQESQGLIGVILDSSALPQVEGNATRLTVMYKRDRLSACFLSKENELNIESVKQHSSAFLHETLACPVTPDYIEVHVLERCIPQYGVGHANRSAIIESLIKKSFQGKLYLSGNAWDGVGVNDAILRSKKIVRALNL